MTELQERLDAAFSANTDAPLVRAVSQGILLADGMIASESWLRGRLGRDVRGILRRAAILSRVYDACKEGDLPFLAALEHMPRGPFHWVEIRSGGFTAHICRTEGAGMFPVDTPTRQDERFVNQPGLFDAVMSISEVLDKKPELFTWLTFGVQDDGQLDHLCWGMPAADGESWLAHSNVLFRLAVAGLEIEPEPPAPRVALKFREEIEDALSNADEADAED